MIIELGLRRGTSPHEAAEAAKRISGARLTEYFLNCIETVQVVDKAPTVQGSPHALAVAKVNDLLDIARRLRDWSDGIALGGSGEQSDDIDQARALADEAETLLRQINAD